MGKDGGEEDARVEIRIEKQRVYKEM